MVAGGSGHARPRGCGGLGTLRTLAHDTQNSAVRSAAERAIRSISVIEGLKAQDPAARIAAAETVGGLGWRATPALPALLVRSRIPEVKVRLASGGALRALDIGDIAAVSALATALPAESNAAVRAAFLDTLETIAPGTRAVLDAHLSALHDPDPQVRKAAARFRRVPGDDSLVSALTAALADPSDQVRLAAALSLSEIMFENPTVIPALVKAMGNDTQRKAILQALGEHLEKTSERADFGRVRGNLPGLRATLTQRSPRSRRP